MAFSSDNRVRVKDQTSQHRNHLGTVKAADDGVNQVRLDGMADSRAVEFSDSQLQLSTQPCPIEYPSDE